MLHLNAKNTWYVVFSSPVYGAFGLQAKISQVFSTNSPSTALPQLKPAMAPARLQQRRIGLAKQPAEKT